MDEGRSSWGGIDVKWATVHWTGTWDAAVKRVAVDPTTGNMLAMGVATVRDIAEDQVDSFSGWVGMHAKEDGVPRKGGTSSMPWPRRGGTICPAPWPCPVI